MIPPSSRIRGRPTTASIDRRDFLRLAGSAGAGALLLSACQSDVLEALSTDGGSGTRWSEPSTWGDGVPGPGDVAVISGRTVILDEDVRVGGIVIERGGALVFDPNADRTLTATRNVVVHGRLHLRPRATAVHRLVFEGVDERAFVGSGHDVLDTDVGLWIREEGVLDAVGSPKLAWIRAKGSVARGSTRILLMREPRGWRAGDEIAVVPTAPDDVDGFEILTIASVNATERSISLDQPVAADHPSVRRPDGDVMTAEILNLTRNVNIEGTPGGRSHIHIMTMVPQRIRHIGLRHLGPVRGEEAVVGRYGLHFHHCMDGSRGSLVEGVLARDQGNHAFVPHGSHGITFRHCVAFGFGDDAYWWDRLEPDGSVALTNDATYDRCVAAQGPSSGFLHQFGSGNAAVGCVAVGVVDPHEGMGYSWPAGPRVGELAVWTWKDNVAHNCDVGINVWQNTSVVHVVQEPVMYHNRVAGIRNGAYRNPYVYRDGVVVGTHALELHASGATAKTPRGGRQEFVRMACDAAGADHAVDVTAHGLAGSTPALLLACSFSGYAVRAVLIEENTSRGNSDGGDLDFVRCTAEGAELQPSDFDVQDIHPETTIRVQRSNGTAFSIHGSGGQHTVEHIPAFHS